MAEPFWRTKTLAEMNSEEWESLCDGCAQCCQVKLEDEDSGRIGCTTAVCHLLDIDACRCGDYPNRHVRVPDCIEFGASIIASLAWLPDTCAYRLLAEGNDLHWWHPLVSGDPESVHPAGISVRSFAVSEADIAGEDLEEMVMRWITPKTDGSG